VSSRRGVRHGGGVAAPSESGALPEESPVPAPVTVGSARPTARRASALGAVLRLVVGVATVGGLSLAIAWAAHRYAVQSPRFAVKDLTVTGNRHFSASDVSRLGGVTLGQNLFSVDPRVVEDALVASPWIERARVSRSLPGALRIEVVEREPAGLVVLDGRPWLVTSEGRPWKELGEGDPADLPLVTGVGTRELAADRARAEERIQGALAAVREYESLPVARSHPPQEAHVETGGDLVLTVGRRGIALHLGRGPFRSRLLMAARILGKLQTEGGEVPQVLFLDNEAHPERVVVRMR